MRFSAGMAKLSLQVYRQFGAGCLVLRYKQTDLDLLILEQEDCNDEVTHSDTVSLMFSCNHGFA